MSFFISTGEISGDIYAGKLALSIKKIMPQEEVWGMAGELASGMNREWSNESLHIMGLGGILSALPKLFRLRNDLADSIVKRNPKAVIVIDSPDFHIPLLSRVRSLGYKGLVVYVSPPTIWAWRKGRAKYLRRYCDLCLPLFLFEERVLKECGVNGYWCGHPLVDDFTNYTPQSAMPPDDKRVAILPGSRRSEITTLLPVLEETAVSLQKMGMHPVFSVAPGLKEPLKKMIMENASGIEYTLNSGRDLMHASSFVVGASGTAAVEAMLLGKYMIVLYKGTKLEWTIFSLLSHTRYVSIPNILAGYEMYPELLQDKAKVENVMDYATHYLINREYHDSIDSQIRLNLDLMGESGATDRWAQKICEMVKS